MKRNHTKWPAVVIESPLLLGEGVFRAGGAERVGNFYIFLVIGLVPTRSAARSALREDKCVFRGDSGFGGRRESLHFDSVLALENRKKPFVSCI